MATLTDVARKSGASIATVSRVINGQPGLVADDTRERVLAAVRELRYRPTPNRVRQRSAATQNLAVILGDIEPRALTREPYFLGLFEGMLDEAAANGYSLTVHVQRLWKEAEKAVRHRFDGHCDGAIAVAPLETDELTRSLWDRGTPLVTLGADLGLAGVAVVDVDNVAAGERAVRLLQAEGHRQIAYLGVTDRIVSSRERREGCLRAAASVPGLVLHAYSVGEDATERGIPLESDRTPGWIADALERAFAADPAPTGLVCWNDSLARQAISALRASGKRVPEDVSVVGFDDTGGELTSLRQPLYDLGRTAVTALLGLVSGEPAPISSLRLPAELIVRESVGRPAAPVLEEENPQ